MAVRLKLYGRRLPILPEGCTAICWTPTTATGKEKAIDHIKVEAADPEREGSPRVLARVQPKD